ncbi:MAG: class I SAM-dependent rRNA methyltransferase [Planctomycetota bacterium]
MIPQIFLNAKQAKHFDGRHPWVLERSVVEPTAAPQDGQVVELMHPNGSWIGRGVYNSNSRIRVRLYQWDRESTLNEHWLRGQLNAAVSMRKQQSERHSASINALRLVNSEGDGLSGLVVDRFGDYLVIQFTSLAMYQHRELVVNWFVEELQPAGIQVNVDQGTAKQEGLEPESNWVQGSGPGEPLSILESGVRLELDLNSGQKTGYYLDQRANRQEAARWMQPGSLLDVCCYHGGFSLAASQTGLLTQVTAVDSSQKALDHAQCNVTNNGFENVSFEKADCFDYLKAASEEGKRFDNIVLDPPRMAGGRGPIQSALRAYHRLNLSAVNVLKPGGTLVTCSCSGRVYRDEFWGVLSSVAKRTRRRIQVVRSLAADFDHPIDVNCPESDYLKCLICKVY